MQVLAQRVDVSRGEQVQRLADATASRFGAPNFVFNNAGVGAGGLVWKNSLKDWEWVSGVNLMGVVHGLRAFTLLMLQAAARDRDWRGHIVNTASMAGLVNMPNMGVYNVSKHAVVSLSESLYQDLALLSDQVHAHVLCPYFVPTGINRSERNRPGEQAEPDGTPTRSQEVGREMGDKAVGSGRVTAAMVAQIVFDGVDENRFYIFSHPHALKGVQMRMEDVLGRGNPTYPFIEQPEVGQHLRDALRGG